MFLPGMPLYGDRHQAAVSLADHYSVSIGYFGVFNDEIGTVLERGLRSRITFQIRIYKYIHGILGIFGDRIQNTIEVEKTARWDLFHEEYVVSLSGGTEERYSGRTDFQNAFFQVTDFRLDFKPENPDDFYILTRVVIEKEVLVPPLNLLDPILESNKITTSWIRTDLGAVDKHADKKT